MARPRRVPPEALQPYLIDLPHPRSPRWRELRRTPVKLDWPALFGNDRPVHVEVGFGKGMFLINASRARPDLNFLGIELERKYVLLTAARLAKQPCPNVRLACTDARWLLKECVAPESVAALHIYFPDPWWKQRHQKRKLFTAEFAEQCARVLAPGGVLHFVTDVEAYFDETCAMVVERGLARQSEETPAAEFLTNFERKYRQQGRPIFRARFVKASVGIGRGS
ncbi:MAG: tRNA (guanosine(46)-N7)-methyltransferase TrmB [Gemmataceae bacterium]|nr:tRNA (guanosine(46)-N7)-methyltransferase TrmB [Gemmataceae bacterium]